MNLHEGRIGAWEGVSVLTIALVSKLMFQKMELLSLSSGNTAWLESFAGAAVAAITFLLALYLLRDGGNLIDALGNNLGSIPGRAITLILCALLLFDAAETLSSFYLILKMFIYINTDAFLLLGIITLAAGIPAFMGFECVSRTAKMFFVLLLFVIVCLILFPMRQYELSRLFPLFGDGLSAELLNGASGSIMYLDLIAIAVLVGPLHGARQVKRVGWWAFGISSAVTILVFLAISLTFSSGLLNDMIAPLYRLATGITMNRSLVRVDDYLVFLWIMCATVGISFTLYLVSNIICRTSGITETRPVAPLVCLIAMSAAGLLQISPVFYNGIEPFVTRYGFLFVLCPLALAALAAFFRRRRRSALKEARSS